MKTIEPDTAGELTLFPPQKLVALLCWPWMPGERHQFLGAKRHFSLISENTDIKTGPAF
jgi:hypothetical protein